MGAQRSTSVSPPEAPLPEGPDREQSPLRAVENDAVLPAPLPFTRPARQAVDLPELPARAIGVLAVFVFEAVEGTRQLTQLARWLTPRVTAELTEIRRLNIERRSLYHDDRRVVPAIRRVRATHPTPNVTEAAVVLATPSRSRAVALRFEVIRGRWQATSASVL